MKEVKDVIKVLVNIYDLANCEKYWSKVYLSDNIQNIMIVDSKG